MAIALPQALIAAAVPNPNLFKKDGTKKTAFDFIVDFTGTANGAFRTLQLLEKLTKVAIEVLKNMGSAMVGFFENLAGKFGLGWVMLTLPRLPQVTQDGTKAAVELWNGRDRSYRDTLENVHDVAECAAAYGYAASVVFASSAAKNFADVPDLAATVTDLTLETDNWLQAKKYLEVANALPNAADPVNFPAGKSLEDKLKLSLMKMVKNTASAVSGVFGMMALALGYPVLSALTFLALGLTSTVAAISAAFFEKTREHKLPDFTAIQQAVILHVHTD